MKFRTFCLIAGLALSSHAQEPTPTPTATPAPTPETTPSPDASPSPEASPTPEPSPTPADAAAVSGMPDPDSAEADIRKEADELDIPASFADPGPPPSLTDPPTYQDVSPSPATIRKMNEEAAAKIEAFAKSLRNPNVPDFTIDQAISTAIGQNPTVLNAIEQIRLTRGQVIEVRAQALPQIDLLTSYEQQQNSLANPKQPSIGGGGGGDIQVLGADGEVITLDLVGGSGGFSADRNNKMWNVQFQASQLLFNGGAVIAGIRAAKHVEDSAFFSLRQTINQTIADVKTQFFQVVLNRALIVAQQQSVELLTQQLKDQQNRYEAGTVPRFNVLQAEVALANAQPPLIQAQNNLRISQYQLVKLLGMDYSPAKPSEIPFNVVGNLAYRLHAIDTNASIRASIERNPALKAQRQNLLAQAQNVRVQFAGYLPTVSATADYQWLNNTAFQDLGEVTQGWTFGFQGSWAIFDGFETKGRVDQARAQLEQAVNNYNDGVRQVILDVQQAISNLQTAQETVQSQEASVTQATEAFRLSQERLDAGAGTQLDVLNAQTQLLQAQTNVLQARYDYINALAQYNLALSLDAQYEEVFDDPLSPRERKQFNRITAATAPQPPLPGKLEKEDPIKGFAANAPGATPVPSPTPSPVTTEDSKEVRKPRPKIGRR